jgi:hypothetical protein
MSWWSFKRKPPEPVVEVTVQERESSSVEMFYTCDRCGELAVQPWVMRGISHRCQGLSMATVRRIVAEELERQDQRNHPTEG